MQYKERKYKKNMRKLEKLKIFEKLEIVQTGSANIKILKINT